MVKIENYLGKLTGWNQVTMNFLGRDVVGIDEIDYGDNTAKENAYGAGNMPVGWTEGNYEPRFSASFYDEEMQAIQRALPPGKRIQDIEPFDVIVQYAHPQTGIIVTDIIHNVQLSGRAKNPKQSEGKMTNKYDCLCSHITWGS